MLLVFNRFIFPNHDHEDEMNKREKKWHEVEGGGEHERSLNEIQEMGVPQEKTNSLICPP